MNYKVIDEGGAAIDQEVDGVRDTRNLGLGAIVALNPDDEQTILMLENKTIAPVDSDEAKAVETPAAEDGQTKVQNGAVVDGTDGTPVDGEPKPEDGTAPTEAAAATDGSGADAGASADAGAAAE